MDQRLAGLLDDCVHCGFCLASCPTYALWAQEPDSPRGRIAMMRPVLSGAAPVSPGFLRHIDSCLGCLACEPACPSGVRYGELIEASRALIEGAKRHNFSERVWRAAILGVFTRPPLARMAALGACAWRGAGLEAVGRRARRPARLAALLALAPPLRLGQVLARLPAEVPAAGAPRLRAALVTGCVQAAFFGGVHQASLRVLAAEGATVVVPPGQGCCGALLLHAGRVADALARARALLDRFSGAGEVDVVLVNAAGCGSTLKDYGRLLAGDPDYAERAARFAAKVADVSEVLAGLEPRAPRHRIEARVAYHDACHLAMAQRVVTQPRAVLGAIPGLELVELAGEACCGSAGIYNLVQPEAAAELGRRKAEAVRAAGADALASGNPGCLLQLQRYLGGDLPMFHPIELVDASIRGLDPLGGEKVRGR